MQGWRDEMEDAHIALPNLLTPTTGRKNGWCETAVFAVMDGHGGEQVARFCKVHLPAEIAKFPSDDVPGALRGAFHRMDDMLTDPRNHHLLCALSNRPTRKGIDPAWIGCTAIVCCICRDTIIVANAGDSRAVLCRGGVAVNMSEDHKPQLPMERARIESAGGRVVHQLIGTHVLHRVNGDLSLSRSIGDLRYKKNAWLAPEEQMICSTPDIRTFRRRPNDEFMVIACDGVWDVLGSQEVVDCIRPQLGGLLSGSVKPSQVAESLLDKCLSPDPLQTNGIGGDNMTLLVVAFTKRPVLLNDIRLPNLLHSFGSRKRVPPRC